MMHLRDLPTKLAKPGRKNPLAGAIDIALADAERYGTTMIVKGKDGKIEEVTPAVLRRRLAKSK
jgi:hypothetical protein